MMSTRPLTSRLECVFVCAFVLVLCVVCAGLVSAAALVPAPPVVVPFISGICVGCAFAAGIELPSTISVLRDPTLGRLRGRHISRLRRDLDRLPQTDHPLGL
jgi:uncharacterized membrane protein AbrB (regulator of aidB expression)